MLIHSEKLNQCKCGSKKTPNLDSDDMVPCWGVKCFDCGQFQHGSEWTFKGAVNKWNEENPITVEVHISTIRPGDTILHTDGKIRTVCKNNIKKGFTGITLFGDPYKSGYTPVKKVIL